MKKLLLLLALLLPCTVQSDVLTVQGDATNMGDGKIRQSGVYEIRNFGSGTTMAAVNSGTSTDQRFIFQFTNLDTIGAGKAFDTLQVILNCETITGANTIIACNKESKPYIEGDSNNVADPGATCWSVWYYDADTTLDSAWGSIGCSSGSDPCAENRSNGSGCDYVLTPLDVDTLSATGLRTFTITDTAMLNACYAGTQVLTLVFRETSSVGLSQYSTVESSTPANRPSVRMVYHSTSAPPSGTRRVKILK